MIAPVGTLGGYRGRALDIVPQRNGLLTFAVDGRPSALSLFWCFGDQGGTFPLGDLGFPAAPPAAPSPPALSYGIAGWITLEQREGAGRALYSRAWPAVRVEGPDAALVFHTTATQVLGVAGGPAGPLDLTSPLTGLDEPWLVFFGHAGADDAPVLLTFARGVTSLSRLPDGYSIRCAAPGAVHAMPLEGIQRRPAGQTDLDAWIATARAWVAPLLAFPTACTESAAVDGERVTITARFTHEVLTDDWGNRGDPLAPFPPALVLAAEGGYPVEMPEGLVRDSAQLCLPTFHGPFQFVRGDGYAYVLPRATGSDALPVPPRSRAPEHAPIRAELDRLVSTLPDPRPDYVDDNLRVAAFLADALPDLDDAQRTRAAAYFDAAFEGALRPLFQATEPVTGQAWSTLAKTWRAHFPDDADLWGRDNERFDSEFYNGQALAALELAARTAPALGARFWAEAQALYAYDQLFFDWATGSVFTQATGVGANIDGVQFAWEGILAMGRLARAAGDAALALDAAYRAARQEAAIVAMWQQAAWSQRWSSAVGHVTKARLAPSAVETVGPVDAFVEEVGAATLEFGSFWQCTNFLFFANRPLFELYRRRGLVPRIRAVEYDRMPALHPRWQDGNASEAGGENGQTQYGTVWTAAHLAARASLFGEDPLPLFQSYLDTAGTPAASTWYCMQQLSTAGPLMLALLESGDGAEAADGAAA
jgi:hypothetical protein